mmetsp:Transcript_12913/g.35180  ORF Transcript_12913/g.35180 Transcript_12913/m.35180 type:complete len:389 (-) Transcript_12913:111-1277(-)
MRSLPLAGAASFLVASAGALLIFRWRRKRYGGLESLVSYSSRIIAALRALETRKGEGHALIWDPFAEKLAGPQAMAEVLGRRQAGDSSREGSAGTPSINRLILRTLLIDDFVRLAVRAEMSEQERSRALRCPMLRQLTDWLCAQGTACKQVVLLGAGMDTRAWRLHLPGGVHWWEVDVAEVLEAKRAIMRRAGASFSSAGRLKKGAHQLQCASYASAPADLQVPGWTSQCLVARGLDPQAPTAWVVEGLLYYLAPSAVPVLLEEIASVSAPGSCMAASIVGEGLVQRMQEKQRSGHKEPSISSAFQWGCPGDPKEFFMRHGWDVIDAPNWVEIAEDMGFKAEVGDQKTNDDTTLGTGEAPMASDDKETMKATRRARSAYLVARIKATA